MLAMAAWEEWLLACSIASLMRTETMDQATVQSGSVLPISCLIRIGIHVIPTLDLNGSMIISLKENALVK